MSTLTSSPSPAVSPRSAFHIQRTSSYSVAPSSQGPSPRHPFSPPASSPSPRRVFNAPSTSFTSRPRAPRENFIESPSLEKSQRFVDAATQYSPDGSPPTSTRSLARDERFGRQRPGATPSSAGKKRKGSESPDPMSTSGNSSGTTGSASSGAARRNLPQEPDPRSDPAPTTLSTGNGANNAGTSPAAGHSSRPEPELEEARSTHGHSSAPKRSKPEPGTTKVMPTLYQNCNPKDLGNLISNMLMELIRLNDRIPLRDGKLTRFHSRAPPGISVTDYLQRLIHHATLSPPILLSMVWYIDRLCQLYPAFTINSLTVHRFLITAATVAAKGLSDSFWTNPTYARIGGIPVSELATLELEFLQKVQWKIVPKPEVLEDYYRSLVERTEGYDLDGRSGSESSSLDESDGSAENQKDGQDQEMADEGDAERAHKAPS